MLLQKCWEIICQCYAWLYPRQISKTKWFGNLCSIILNMSHVCCFMSFR
uniref:Uncharacterized protein n=1 Tax=Arundo donax TaxID=35708 RepID=A0A0A9GS49_ARUDO